MARAQVWVFRPSFIHQQLDVRLWKWYGFIREVIFFLTDLLMFPTHPQILILFIDFSFQIHWLLHNERILRAFCDVKLWRDYRWKFKSLLGLNLTLRILFSVYLIFDLMHHELITENYLVSLLNDFIKKSLILHSFIVSSIR